MFSFLFDVFSAWFSAGKKRQDEDRKEIAESDKAIREELDAAEDRRRGLN
jgi:hypothetical protein